MLSNGPQLVRRSDWYDKSDDLPVLVGFDDFLGTSPRLATVSPPHMQPRLNRLAAWLKLQPPVDGARATPHRRCPISACIYQPIRPTARATPHPRARTRAQAARAGCAAVPLPTFSTAVQPARLFSAHVRRSTCTRRLGLGLSNGSITACSMAYGHSAVMRNTDGQTYLGVTYNDQIEERERERERVTAKSIRSS